MRNILRSEAGSITSWSGTNIIRESYNLKDWQQFSLPISFFFFMSVNGSDNHANCQESKKCWFPHGCCVECLCRSKSERQVKLKWLNHLIFLGKREDRKSCAHMSAKLNQLISKLALTFIRQRALIILLLIPFWFYLLYAQNAGDGRSFPLHGCFWQILTKLQKFPKSSIQLNQNGLTKRSCHPFHDSILFCILRRNRVWTETKIIVTLFCCDFS